MKNILILLTSLVLLSCDDAKMSDAIVVEQINILNGSSHKYEVKLKTDVNSNDVFYYTNFRHQVGDTMISFYENFENQKSSFQNQKSIIQERDNQILNLTRVNDSLKKELEISNYYLELLQRKLIFDTIKRKH